MKKTLLYLTVLLFFFIMNAEGVMNTPEIIKPENVKAGDVNADKEGEKRTIPLP